MKNKKIIIVGGDSFIGKKLISFFQIKKITFLATSKKIRKQKNFIYFNLKSKNNYFYTILWRTRFLVIGKSIIGLFASRFHTSLIVKFLEILDMVILQYLVTKQSHLK